jgi:RNA polymerase primary sigma factor
MWQIVSAHEDLVVGIIRQVAPTATREQREDYVQEARAVLVERVRLYDTDAGTALSSFSYATIRRAVLDAALRDACAVTIDPTTVRRVRQALSAVSGDPEAALAAMQEGATPVSRHVFVAAVDAMRATDSLDAPIDGDDGDMMTLADVLADPTGDVTDPWERRELAEWLLTQIRPRESYALRSFYGVGMQRQEDSDTAAHLQITPATVRKTRERGLSSCRTVAARYSVSA